MDWHELLYILAGSPWLPFQDKDQGQKDQLGDYCNNWGGTNNGWWWQPLLITHGQIHYILKKCQIWNSRLGFKSGRKRSNGWLQVVNWNTERMKLILMDRSHKLAIYFLLLLYYLMHNLAVAQLWYFRVISISPVL